MDLYGVIGYPIGHSLSPQIHQRAFQQGGRSALYVGLAVRPEELSATLERMWQQPWQGFNVTVPHKESVIGFLAGLSDQARELGAVNVVVRRPNGWYGANTDLEGFLATLPIRPERALVLGAGGAARAVVGGLQSLGCAVTCSTRNPARLYRLVDQTKVQGVAWDDRHRMLDALDLLVNATPVGQAPDAGVMPLDHLDGLGASTWVYDLVYRPSPTKLLREAAARGLKTVSGVAMLAAQAALSWELWFGEHGPELEFLAHLRQLVEEEAKSAS